MRRSRISASVDMSICAVTLDATRALNLPLRSGGTPLSINELRDPSEFVAPKFSIARRTRTVRDFQIKSPSPLAPPGQYRELSIRPM